ncbi:MAG: hypothetical protein ACR2P1_22275 [Pseudomonadales bacterium]
MANKQRSLLTNFNRSLIFALTLLGLLMDGYQGADLPSTLALVVWLWLPHCARLEANLLTRVNVGRAMFEPLRRPELWRTVK